MKAKALTKPIGAGDASALFAGCFHQSTGILIAVSGGPDSMALMALLADWPDKPRLCVATVDHGLRPESGAEALLVRDAAQKLSLPHKTLSWTGAKPSHGIQSAARDERYRLLCGHAISKGLSHIALAHHADDQAETVLMRLAAGSGITGAGGMAVESLREGVTLVRPFLSQPKDRLIATCRARGISYVEDPSNTDIKYGRTRTRALLKQTAAEGLTAERLTVFASRARRGSEALETITAAALSSADVHHTECVARANWNSIARHPAEIRLRALMALVRLDVAPQPPVRLERFEALLGEIDIAHGAAKRLRRSIGENIVTLQSDGAMVITQAPPRKRGKRGIGKPDPGPSA